MKKKKKQQLTKRGYFKKYRGRIFKNNRIDLDHNERVQYAEQEIIKQAVLEHMVGKFDIHHIYVDSYDSFLSVQLYVSSKEWITGYSKRMPNDIPNDRIGIQVAVSKLIKRLKEK